MIDTSRFREGMTVRSADGDKLVKVVGTDARGLRVEKGIFFPKEYVAALDQVDQVTGDEIYLRWGTEMVEQQHDSLHGAGDYERETKDESRWTDFRNARSPFSTDRSAADRSATDGLTTDGSKKSPVDRTIPVREEQLQVDKRGMKEVGNVRIFKTVRTEDQHFTVPIRREEVRIERVAATGANRSDKNSASGEMPVGELKEETITIPIREEEVVITKRPVVREQVQVRTSSEQINREVRGTVRKEEVRIDREGDKLGRENLEQSSLDRNSEFESSDLDASMDSKARDSGTHSGAGSGTDSGTELMDDAAKLSERVKRQRKAS